MISIIIPVYNQAKKLEKCLESILNQTINNYEIIVLNDRSQDKFSSVVEKYKKEFGYKLDVINNQSNHGAPYTRNKGYYKSKGEYLLFCDADIILEPNALEIMLETLQKFRKASYAYSAHYYGYKLFKSWEFDAEKLKQMPYIHTTALIRRSDFPEKGWDEDLQRLQDWDLWLTMLDEGHVGCWIDKVLFTVQPGGVYSTWLPSFVYKLLPFLPKVKKYKKAVEIVQKKHHII